MRGVLLLLCSWLVILTLGLSGLDAATTKKRTTHKREDFTPAQREKLMEEARKICKKRYGAGARVYQLDYHNWRVICLE